ncbi:MAG TPA: 4Fe-4S dicluster domain-containing protein [Candidatus Krumholzibacteria bacterium]|jgi:NAD-dependent dihydropyrimidine dehydrogenase PreA subunit|nr:4Fe-4S dicluster domain-containing protein [Candidatus Krumholzibacteria bacterium]
MSTKSVEDRGKCEVIPDLCKGCGLCISMCPETCIVRDESLNRRGYRPAVYEGHGCTGCGICFSTCPEPSAIIVTRFR